MVILFDGVCNLCNGFVAFIIKRDRKNLFKFASLQSKYGRGLRQHFGLSGTGLDTVLLYDGKNVYIRSDASMKILTSLGNLWGIFTVFKLIPRFIRDAFYNFMARRRYRFFGKRENCMAPTEELKNRFIDDLQFSGSDKI